MCKPEDFKDDQIVLIKRKNKPSVRGHVVGRTSKKVKVWKMKNNLYIRVFGNKMKKKVFKVDPKNLEKVSDDVIEKENLERVKLLLGDVKLI